METGANIVRRYAKSEPVERIDIICAHYENFTSIIDSFEVSLMSTWRTIEICEIIAVRDGVLRETFPKCIDFLYGDKYNGKWIM